MAKLVLSTGRSSVKRETLGAWILSSRLSKHVFHAVIQQ